MCVCVSVCMMYMHSYLHLYNNEYRYKNIEFNSMGIINRPMIYISYRILIPDVFQ